MWKLAGGVLLGWGLGSNNCANCFGTGVAVKILRYRTAVILASIFVILGALIEGPKCFATVGKLSNLSATAAFFAASSAGIIVAAMSYLGLPISASQAIIGAVFGIGLISGFPGLDILYKVIICWILTPVSAIVVSYTLYGIIGFLFKALLVDVRTRTVFITAGFIFAGCYGSYSLGANNVANVTGVYVGSGILSPIEASMMGGLAMASGILTYGKKVMTTVGKKITALDEYSAFVATLAQAITVHIFTQVGVPVSTSHAIVGTLVGVGLVKGGRAISRETLLEIGIAWVATPFLAGAISYGLMRLFG
jgi:PiT family inorganic phosphate transporter